MARRETVVVRLDQIEAFLPAMAVQVEALRLLFALLVDADFDRADDQGDEPLVVPMVRMLETMLEQAEPESPDAAEQIKTGAIAAALRIIGHVESEEFDVEIDDGGPANDD